MDEIKNLFDVMPVEMKPVERSEFASLIGVNFTIIDVTEEERNNKTVMHMVINRDGSSTRVYIPLISDQPRKVCHYLAENNLFPVRASGLKTERTYMLADPIKEQPAAAAAPVEDAASKS